MADYFKILRPIIFALPPETAHNLAIWALKHDLLPPQEQYRNKKLQSSVFGLEFTNPVGLAAGFDKNANCIPALAKQNFGFIEVGTVTPEPQKGNPRPRIFRLKKEQAIINRMGFPNLGAEIFSQRLRQWKYSGFGGHELVVGANIGRNKKSPNDESDYLKCLERVYGLCDYLVVNISSPNTPGLREMQEKKVLSNLLSAVRRRRKEITTKYKGKMPILVKISPDETDKTLQDIAEILLKKKIDGVIISNTSVRDKKSNNESFAENKRTGGLSGKPIFKKSTDIIEKFYRLTNGQIPIIGVGGVSSAEEAYDKIRKGASLVQVYTAFVYQGFGLVNKINKGLVELLERDGFNSMSEAVGVDVKK